MSSLAETVRYGLAMHLRVDAREVRKSQRLREDLGLRPIDLVWIAMRVESLGTGDRQFPVELLSRAETVGDLVTAFEAWAAADNGIEDTD